MITDEQIIEALTAYLLDGYGARSLKESMRKALEAYEQSKLDKIDQQKDNTINLKHLYSPRDGAP